ncbi:hypothetical protein GCM10007972_21220 [Iodidimonas muriae]|uniref:DUF2059 domain-containing protein n=2 Tax=Iodidimonas muriae TaxID=261467 RepID=A0ABQ2LEX8_9PROT|nr:hypothetical protein JCM17843_18020 [Kordiimonadales bacterium JCM 17843]GGO14269.1 hypothetical protein GCM10007972_21220 [Iodidimonas muriae]
MDVMMRYVMMFVMLVAIGTGGWGHTARAQDLNTDMVERFIESLPGIIALGQNLQESGQAAGFQDALRPTPESGFTPYSRGAAWLENNSPENFNAMMELVESNGFSDVQSWARTGDQVMAAFMATEIETMSPESRRMAEQVSPEMLAQMPHGVREQIEGMRVVLDAVKQVPQAHIDIVRPLIPLLKEKIGN